MSDDRIRQKNGGESPPNAVIQVKDSMCNDSHQADKESKNLNPRIFLSII